MPPTTQWSFGPFRLDPRNACLWHGAELVPLPPTAFALLHYLVMHAGQLVTKDEFFAALWAETAVSEAVLKVRMGEVRKALGETAREPRYITTVHRRGYRFVAPVTRLEAAPGAGAATRDLSRPPRSPTVPPPPRPASLPPLPRLVGRERELAQLQQCWTQARQGQRQVVFVTGEAGIGKTTLVDSFVAQVAATEAVWLGQGQCIEQYGAGEAYLPVLEALGRLCQAPGADYLLTQLRVHAPTWLVQMPWVLSPADHEALRYTLLGATQARMLREMAAWIEAVTVETPLVLVLEDVHWSDTATLDVVAWLARRQEPARLLLVGTYRPAEVLTRGHPIRAVQQALQLHGHCATLPLACLSEAAVAAYLRRRLPGSPAPTALARMIHQRTEGNPLFMVHVVEELLRQGPVVEPQGGWGLPTLPAADVMRVPEDIRQMLALQLDRLPLADQRLLEAASVAGAVFAAASVAAGVARDVVTTEEHCERLARRQQFLRPAGTITWPDGTVTGRYAFMHALYQHVVYEQIAAARRIRLHQRIGARLEAAYGAQAGDMAAELAMHFDQGRDAPRAIHYLQQAGDNALWRSAHHTAITHLTTAVQLLETLPDTPERTRREVALHLALGNALTATHGSAAPETGAAFRRAYTLSAQGDDPEQAFNAVRGLALFHILRGEPTSAQELGEHLLRQTHHSRQAILRLEAHRTLGGALLWQGQVRGARDHLEQGLALYEPQHRVSTFLYGIESGVASRILLSLALWVLGYPAQARQQNHAAMTLAQELAHPLSLAYARTLTAMLYQWSRESTVTHQWTETTIALTTEHGFRQFRQTNASLRGWALVQHGLVAEGLTTMRQSLDAWQAMGANLYQPYLLALLAEAHALLGHIDEGIQRLDDALAVVGATGEGLYEAELYRLQGDLLRAYPSTPPRLERAEVSLHRALAIARQQQAKAWELRAARSLARLWQQQGKRAEAYALLAPIYGWFTEGFDTADLQEAKALLEALGG